MGSVWMSSEWRAAWIASVNGADKTQAYKDGVTVGNPYKEHRRGA